jgi:hypothetical protein
MHGLEKRRITRPLAVGAIALAILVARAAGAAPSETILGPATWEAARGLLPEEILAHYRSGEYANRIVDGTPAPNAPWITPEFAEATRANRDRFAIGPTGSIVDARTGAQASGLMGLPFPAVDAGDPQAGVKIVWNYVYAVWYRGDYHFLTELVMLGRRGVERRIQTDVKMHVQEGAPDARAGRDGDDLFVQAIARVVAPADLCGTVSLTWRHRDGAKHDSFWTFVPGLRRPRLMDPLNRSDGFLGSDLSLDDGNFFDAKPEDFTFTVQGRQDQLVLIDPFALRGDVDMVPVEGGGWRTLWKDVPRIGADDPGWRGVPWAPVSSVLVRRPVWVVEARPKDRRYLYGRIVLRFDAETYLGSWASKYDRAGNLAASYQVSSGPYQTPDGGRTWIQSGGIPVQIAENLVYKRATAVLFPARAPNNPADMRVPLSSDRFGPDVLVQLGR